MVINVHHKQRADVRDPSVIGLARLELCVTTELCLRSPVTAGRWLLTRVVDTQGTTWCKPKSGVTFCRPFIHGATHVPNRLPNTKILRQIDGDDERDLVVLWRRDLPQVVGPAADVDCRVVCGPRALVQVACHRVVTWELKLERALGIAARPVAGAAARDVVVQPLV